MPLAPSLSIKKLHSTDELTFNVQYNGKVQNLRTILRLLCVTSVLLTLAGCVASQQKELLVVEFKPDTVLEYKLVSEREITLDLLSDDPKMQAKNKPQKMSEKLELVIAYKPLEIDPFGLTTIEGTCKSAKVTRTSFTSKAASKDAVEQLAGETFIIKLSPTGKISDYSSLTEVVRKLGKKAFDTNSRGKQRIKNPDMIHDFIAMQWYLWDSVATIDNPLDGVEKGTSWETNQLVPLPIPIIAARKTTYTFDEIEETPDGRKAMIDSSYVLTKEKLQNWPSPYSGSFAMRGMFGFLRNYKYESLTGTGRQVFDVDLGVVQSDQQQYTMKITAAFMLPLGDSVPTLTIVQKNSAELIKN